MPLRVDNKGDFHTAPACTHLSADENLPDAALPSGALFSVPLERWQTERDALLGRADALGARIGVRINGDDAVDELAPALDRAALVVVEFPRFTDGRGYSQARLLRERYGYRGELRASGDVLRDQIAPLARCGIDAFELDDGVDAVTARAALDEISVCYQPSANRFDEEQRDHRLAS